MADQYFIYSRAMQTFEDYESRDEDVQESIEAVKPHLRGPGADLPRAAFEWWTTAYAAAREARSVGAIKGVAREYLCADHEHARTPYNIAQGLMKATVHRLWKNLYHARTSCGHARPREAIRDAFVPERERAIEYMRELLGEIAAERGETAEGMVSRLDRDGGLSAP